MRMRIKTHYVITIFTLTLIVGFLIPFLPFGRNLINSQNSYQEFSQSPQIAAPTCAFNQIIEINDDTLNYSRGDNDHEIDAGEIIELKISLKNNGIDGATNVNGTLHTSIPSENNLVFIMNRQVFGIVPAGAIVTNFGYFVLRINANCSRDYSIGISLDIEADGGLFWNDIFMITVKGSIELSYSSVTIVSESSGDSVADNDYAIDRGENVVIDIKLKNTGNATAWSLMGTMSSGDSFVSFSDIYGDFGTILGKGGTGTGRFGIRVAGNCPDKYLLPINLTAIDIDGISWLLSISLLVNGTAAYGISSFSLYQYSGDGDQNLDYNEKWYPSITVFNNGTAAGSSVKIYFNSSDPYFSYYYSYSNRYQYNGNIQVGTNITIYSSTVWLFKVSEIVPAGHVMSFQVWITDKSNNTIWNFIFSRTIISARPPIPGDAGYTTDAGDSTSLALSINLEQTYSCSLSAADLVDYFRINVTGSHSYIWIIMSDCSSCSYVVLIYDNNGYPLSYNSYSYGIRFSLNNKVGSFYIRVSTSYSYSTGYYSLKASYTTPPSTTNPPKTNPTPNPSVILGIILVFSFIFICVAAGVVHSKPGQKKVTREWGQNSNKTSNSTNNRQPTNTTLNPPTQIRTPIIPEKPLCQDRNKLLNQAADHNNTADSCFSLGDYLKAEQEYTHTLNKYREVLTLTALSKERHRITAILLSLEEKLIKSLIEQANVAFEKANDMYRKENFAKARFHYQEAIQKYSNGIQRAKNVSCNSIQFVFAKAELNMILCKELLNRLISIESTRDG